MKTDVVEYEPFAEERHRVVVDVSDEFGTRIQIFRNARRLRALAKGQIFVGVVYAIVMSCLFGWMGMELPGFLELPATWVGICVSVCWLLWLAIAGSIDLRRASENDLWESVSISSGTILVQLRGRIWTRTFRYSAVDLKSITLARWSRGWMRRARSVVIQVHGGGVVWVGRGCDEKIVFAVYEVLSQGWARIEALRDRGVGNAVEK